ncbi:hypothetical protein [Bacillus wiedmannii]|uniref:hypothetical protein n=1 Tax=Bacillus wiedmannii TaxID=1890302 RepID=UPI001485A8F3|nr:hypothetical protein [Bacillus wiedmannii]
MQQVAIRIVYQQLFAITMNVADSVYNRGFAPLQKISPEKLQDEREKVGNHR